MPYYGLIGHPIKHSWSKIYFDQCFASCSDNDYHYVLIDLPAIGCIREQVADKRLRGFNVTTPYKECVLPYMSQLSEQATAIGAVNCVIVNPDGSWEGHNTDAPAFAHTLRNYTPHNALVLGSGGAAKAVCYALRCMGWKVNMVSRWPEKHRHAISYDEAAELLPNTRLLVNATPIGMAPYDDKTPWQPVDMIGPQHIVYDLIYNPSPTLLLQEAAKRGATTIDGLAMLHRQAELSWQLWGLCG